MWQAGGMPPDMQRDRHIPDLVSVTEAAEMLDVSRQAIHKMIAEGRLKGAKAGSTVVFRRVAVERYRDTRVTAEDEPA